MLRGGAWLALTLAVALLVRPPCASEQLLRSAYLLKPVGATVRQALPPAKQWVPVTASPCDIKPHIYGTLTMCPEACGEGRRRAYARQRFERPTTSSQGQAVVQSQTSSAAEGPVVAAGDSHIVMCKKVIERLYRRSMVSHGASDLMRRGVA